MKFQNVRHIIWARMKERTLWTKMRKSVIVIAITTKKILSTLFQVAMVQGITGLFQLIRTLN